MKVVQSLVLLFAIYLAQVESQRIKRGFNWNDLNPANWKLDKWVKNIDFRYATIYEGTKWCGKGNVAKDEDDLGRRKSLDRCCRAHDLCDPSIKGGKSKYGIKNKGLITWSHCDCDYEFRRCLKKMKNTHADIVGVAYFDLLKNSCIYQGYKKKCKKFLGIKIKCKKDKSKGKIWMSKAIGKSYLF